jgi:hypothetical protein
LLPAREQIEFLLRDLIQHDPEGVGQSSGIGKLERVLGKFNGQLYVEYIVRFAGPAPQAMITGYHHHCTGIPYVDLVHHLPDHLIRVCKVVDVRINEWLPAHVEFTHSDSNVFLFSVGIKKNWRSGLQEMGIHKARFYRLTVDLG